MKHSVLTTITSYLSVFVFAGALLLGGCTNTVSGPQVEEKPPEVRQNQGHNTLDENGGSTNPREPHNTNPND